MMKKICDCRGQLGLTGKPVMVAVTRAAARAAGHRDHDIREIRTSWPSSTSSCIAGRSGLKGPQREAPRDTRIDSFWPDRVTQRSSHPRYF